MLPGFEGPDRQASNTPRPQKVVHHERLRDADHGGLGIDDLSTAWEHDDAPHARHAHGIRDGTGDVNAIALGVILFLAVWLAMMMAMMFPSLSAMVLPFAHVSKRQVSQ